MTWRSGFFSVVVVVRFLTFHIAGLVVGMCVEYEDTFEKFMYMRDVER